MVIFYVAMFRNLYSLCNVFVCREYMYCTSMLKVEVGEETEADDREDEVRWTIR